MAFNAGAINPQLPSQLGALTAGQLSNLLSNFAGKNVSVWDIDEASYISNATKLANPSALPVPFHVFKTGPGGAPYLAGLDQVQDSYGRRKVKYQFPYKDGQTSDDLGKKPVDYTFNIMIHGPNYLAGVSALFAEISQPTPGVLTHPVFGDIDVIVEDWQVVHSSAQRMAAQITIKFSENSFTLQDAFDVSNTNNKNFSSAMSNVLSAFNKFQSLLNTVTANLQAISTVRQQLINIVTGVSQAYALVAGQLNAAFNSNSPLIPTLFPVNLGGQQNSDGTVTTAATGGLTFNDPFANVPITSLSTAAQTAIAQQATQQSVQAQYALTASMIASLEATFSGTGGTVFHDNILDMKRTLLALQQCLQAGLAASNFSIFQYTTPRDMSAREVCFVNNISLDNVTDIQVLNPFLDSTNNIPKGTTLTVAS